MPHPQDYSSDQLGHSKVSRPRITTSGASLTDRQIADVLEIDYAAFLGALMRDLGLATDDLVVAAAEVQARLASEG